MRRYWAFGVLLAAYLVCGTHAYAQQQRQPVTNNSNNIYWKPNNPPTQQCNSAWCVRNNRPYGAAGYQKSTEEHAYEARQAQRRARSWDLMVGVSAGFLPEYSGDPKVNFTVLPMVIGEYRLTNKHRFNLSPYEGLSYAYHMGKMLEVGVSANMRRGREATDGSGTDISGMPDVDAAIEIGPFMKIKPTKNTYMRVAYGQDVTDEYGGGYTIDFSAGASHKIAKNWVAGVRFNALYGDAEYANTFYSVSTAQQIASRRAYEAEEGFTEAGMNVHATYFLNDNTFLRGDLFYSHLLYDALNSPLTNDDDQYGALGTLGYRF